jgi:cell division transport system ATP-binding protein
LIILTNVSKVYDNKTTALNNINLYIGKGEFAFIVGPSGSGKSTLVRLLMKEIDPTSGEIIVNNFNLNKLARKDIPKLRRSMGVVFQDFRLLSDRNVYENAAFAMRVVGASEKEIRRQVPFILSLVGITKKARMFPNQLSGGEQQRVAIARALVNNPEVIIADEPTGNLDPDTSWEIVKLLDKINKRGTTILMATHDREIVDGMKKRVIGFDKNKIIRDEEKGVYSYGY